MTALRTAPMPVIYGPAARKSEAAQAAGRLALALEAALDSDEPPPCTGTDRDWWTSDVAEERAHAATACAGCPGALFTACHAAADAHRERHHVWAGVDRTPAPVQTRTPRSAEFSGRSES